MLYPLPPVSPRLLTDQLVAATGYPIVDMKTDPPTLLRLIQRSDCLQHSTNLRPPPSTSAQEQKPSPDTPRAASAADPDAMTDQAAAHQVIRPTVGALHRGVITSIGT